MKAKDITVLFFALMLSAAALASEKQRHVQIHVDAQEDHDAAMQSFRFDSDAIDFDLRELQLGESRSFIDEEGNNLFVVRTEKGFDFNVNGREISMPDFTEGDVDAMIMQHGDDIHGEKHVVRGIRQIEMMTDEDIHEISEDMELHEVHEIRIVREEVDVTN